jgi:hypothetical protein
MIFKKAVIVLIFCLWPLLLCGQGAFIQFNNRNHPELSWYVYETDHFRIVYNTGLDEMAKKAGDVAEQVYAIHQKNLGLSFKKKYYIFISDMDAITNGATSPFGYTFFWVNPSDYLTMFTGTESWLQKVTAHEMVHALIFENAKGWVDSFFPLSALLIFVNLEINEGMAQFYAGEKWGVERGDRYLNLAVRDSATTANPFDIDYGGLLYAKGFAKVKWLRQNLTDQQLGKIFSRKNNGIWFNFKKSFKAVTRRSYSDYEKEWKKAINVYFNWREAVSEHTEAVGEKFKKIPGDYLEVVKASPDGNAYAFTGVRSLQSPSYDLYLWEEGKKGLRRLAQKDIKPNFSFDREGRRIVFSRVHHGKNGSVISDLYTVDIHTAKEKAITQNFRAQEPVFINADRIVFIRQEGLASNFYLCRADGSHPEKLTDFKEERYFSDLSVSRTGKKVVASFIDPIQKRYGIAILDIETKTLDEKAMPALCRFPLFSPESSEEILYTSQEDDVPNVNRLLLQTGEREPVTRQSNYLLITDWTAKGKAVGIRQTQRQTNEAFILDPYRKPQLFSGTLQDYYAKWKETLPATPMIIESKDTPGQFRGKFHSLSTFRPLNILPSPVFIKGKLSLGLSGGGADMLGKNLLGASVAFDFRKLANTNYDLSYLNRSTIFDIAASFSYGDVTTYRYQNQKSLYEGITAAGIQFSLPFEHAASYTQHRLSIGFGYEKSVILENSFHSNSGASGAEYGGEPPMPYRIAGFSSSYNIKNIQPYKHFPSQGLGAAVEYGYRHSLSGEEFSYHYFHLTSFKLQPLLGETAHLYLTADMQAIQGRTPPQNRLGMAKYYTSNGIFSFSDQIYIRGGDRYYPGSRLLTASLEMRCPLPEGVSCMVAFLDMAKIWESGSAGWKNGKTLTSYGMEMQIKSLFGSIVGLGVARNVSEKQQGKWRFYITVKSSMFPF